MMSLATRLKTSCPTILRELAAPARSSSTKSHLHGSKKAAFICYTRLHGSSVLGWSEIGLKNSRIAPRQFSTMRPSTYEAPTAENNLVGKPKEEVSHIPWWDKIGVDTAMEYDRVNNWRHPAMTDEEIETLVEQMPKDLELAGLSEEEKSEYLRARYHAIQTNLAKARSERRRSPHTFEPVMYGASWRPSYFDDDMPRVPRDVSLAEEDLNKSLAKAEKSLENYGRPKAREFEHEDIPIQPYGPVAPPPPLPDVSYWKRRTMLKTLGSIDEFMLDGLDKLEEVVAAKEKRLEEEMPWLSKNESLRVSAERKLRSSPNSRELVQRSINSSRSLRAMKNVLVTGRNIRMNVALAAQGGHERLAWHQITAKEWQEMSEVEFAFWRHRIYADWMREKGCKGHEPNVAGTVTLALRNALKDWQQALYQYEEARRPAHLATSDLSIWHYHLTQTEWFKAGTALEKRITDVERRSLLHRRRTVLTYLNRAFADWNSHYKRALETARVVEKWGAKAIENHLGEESQSKERAKSLFDWKESMTLLMQALQEQKEIGPFPFDVPVEKLDQHVMDKIYAHLVVEEEAIARKKEERIISVTTDLPPAPVELKVFLTNPVAMLASSGDDADSGLFGPKLAERRRILAKEGILKTSNEMDRRRDLMLKYWDDHNIKELDIDGTKVVVSKDMSYEVIERVYFDLMDKGLDVHGLYEPRQWEVDQAGRYRASALSPIDVMPEQVLKECVVPTLEALEAHNAGALALFEELVSLAFPAASASIVEKPSRSSSPSQVPGTSMFDISTILNEELPVSEAQVEQAARDTLAVASWSLALKPRNLDRLRWLSSRGSTEVLRAERESAFYSVELGNGEPDPHPHLWETLLSQVFKMRRPPGWLISRCPSIYQDWRGVTEDEMLQPSPSSSSSSSSSSSASASSNFTSSTITSLNPNSITTSVAATKQSESALFQEVALNKTSHIPQDPSDPRRIALLNPRRQAWELSKRVKEYKSLLLGADLTETQERVVKRLRTTTSNLRDLLTGKKIEEVEDEPPPSGAAKRALDEETMRKFKQLRRDIIPKEEIEAAAWMLNFDFKAFCEKYAPKYMTFLVQTKDMEAFKSRFMDSFLANSKGFAEPTRAMSHFDACLNNLVRQECNPEEVLEMETGLFKRRQTIEKASLEGISDHGLALMLHHYTAFALKSKLVLVMKSRAADPTLGNWTARFITPKRQSPMPKTLLAAVAQLITLPFTLVRYWSSTRLPYYSERQIYGGVEEEKQRASVLVTMLQHLEAMNAAQPWRMWTVEPWTWRSVLSSNSSPSSLDSPTYLATSTAEHESYMRSMEIPRKSFWEDQIDLWEDYMDQQLSFFHDLMIEQRAREGIPVHTDDGPTDGTHARNLFNLGETLLAKMKVVEAIDCFDTAARHGSVDAMFALGRIYNDKTYALVSHAIPEEQRLAQPALENKSRYYLEKASNLGHANATFQLVIQCNSPPKGAEANSTLMMNALRVAVEEYQHPGAMLFLATFYEKGSHADQLKAIELLRKVDTPEAHKRANEIYIRIANKNHTESEVLKDL